MANVTDDLGRTATRHTAAGRTAVALATTVAVGVGLVYEALAVTYATDGAAGIADNWIGKLGAVALQLGLIGASAAFVLALRARRQERWGLLRLPLLLFPALVGVIVAVEVAWLE